MSDPIPRPHRDGGSELADTLARTLDAATPEERLAWTLSLRRRDQVQLWSLVEGRGAQMTDVVPQDTPDGVEVIHEGKNTQLAFRRFQKRFLRPEGNGGEFWGFNRGPTESWIGPGFFVTQFFPERDEVGVNYNLVPPPEARLPDHWPRIRKNTWGLQIFVYGFAIDYLRKVSSHVTVGRAVRRGRNTPHYFVLCRQEGPPEPPA